MWACFLLENQLWYTAIPRSAAESETDMEELLADIIIAEVKTWVLLEPRCGHELIIQRTMNYNYACKEILNKDGNNLNFHVGNEYSSDA